MKRTLLELDVGAAVAKAYDRVRLFPHAHGLQADVLAPALKPATFDYVFSNGVIHHTSDTRLAFKRVASLVRPGCTPSVTRSGSGLNTRFVPSQRACLARCCVRSVISPCRCWRCSLRIVERVSGRQPGGNAHRSCSISMPRRINRIIVRGKSKTGSMRRGFEDVVVMPDPVSVTGKRRKER